MQTCDLQEHVFGDGDGMTVRSDTVCRVCAAMKPEADAPTHHENVSAQSKVYQAIKDR